MSAVEALHAEHVYSRPLLFAFEGYFMCDLLLCRGRVAEVIARGRYMQDLAGTKWALDGGLLKEAFNMLTIARAALADHSAASNALDLANMATRSMREANAEHQLPRSLLVNAEGAWRAGDTGRTDECLDEVEEIADRGPMPLFACDAAILRARRYIGQDSLAQGEACRERAAKLVDEQRYRAGADHYGRGAVALAVLDAELALVTGNNAIHAFNGAVAAVGGMPYVNSDTGQTIDGGWFGYLSRLDAIAPNEHVGFMALHRRELAYQTSEDERWKRQDQEWTRVSGGDISNAAVDAFLKDRRSFATLEEDYFRTGLPRLDQLVCAMSRGANECENKIVF
jgi:hypothetical protein